MLYKFSRGRDKQSPHITLQQTPNQNLTKKQKANQNKSFKSLNQPFKILISRLKLGLTALRKSRFTNTYRAKLLYHASVEDDRGLAQHVPMGTTVIAAYQSV